MAIIVAEHLTKKFNDLVAVDRVNLAIEAGECLGLLGPNGAGKTSLIRMITGVSPATEGKIYIMGRDLRAYPRQVKALLGVVPQSDNLDEDLSVLQNLTTFARYFSLDKKEAQRRSREVLEFFKLGEKRDSRIRELSGGMRRRLLIARGLINQPEILILDEPTIGLDPQARHLVWQKLGELKRQGVTLLLCTQNMDEAAVLCDRVAIMHQAKILTLDTPQTLILRYIGSRVVELEPSPETRGEILAELSRYQVEFVDTGSRIQVLPANSAELPAELANLTAKVWQRPATLEDVFFRLTGRILAE